MDEIRRKKQTQSKESFLILCKTEGWIMPREFYYFSLYHFSHVVYFHSGAVTFYNKTYNY